MLSAIKDIGAIADRLDKLPSIRQDLNINKILFIAIDTSDSSFTIEYEDFDSGKHKEELYLFVEGASRGNKPSPFAFLNKKEKDNNPDVGLRTTFKKIRTWFSCEKFKNIEGLNDEEKIFIKKIDLILKSESEKIIEAISEKIKYIPKKEKNYLSIKIDKKYIGEYDIFIKAAESFETKRSVNKMTKQELFAR